MGVCPDVRLYVPSVRDGKRKFLGRRDMGRLCWPPHGLQPNVVLMHVMCKTCRTFDIDFF